MTATLYGGPVTDTPDDLLTVREAAAVLGVTVKHVRDMFRAGRIPATLAAGGPGGRQYLARRSDLLAYLEEHTRVDPAPMVAELGALAERIDAAQKAVNELIAERDRRLVAWVDEQGQPAERAADAARVSRQWAFAVLKQARRRDHQS